MGFVHHSVYALYFEEARTEILRNLGIPYSEVEADGIIMPVRSMSMKFHKAAKYDDLLTINVFLGEVKGLRWYFNYETFNASGELLNTGNTELFFASKETLRPTALPDKWKQQLQQILTS